MNIIEATKQMVKGKKVRRANSVDWLASFDHVTIEGGCYLHFSKDGVWVRTADVWAEDILADDWEVVE